MIPYTVVPCERNEIKQIIEQWHYSHSINGVMSSYCFKLMDVSHEIIGGIIYGKLAMRNQYKPYCENESDIIELRRLVCIDDTPKNTESFFIGASLRWLRKNTKIKCVLSYSDLTHGHIGIVYRASNFKQVGETAPSRMIKRLSDGKLYHDKTIRTKYNGKLKPFAARLKEQLENGDAVYTKTLCKNIYIYRLKK